MTASLRAVYLSDVGPPHLRALRQGVRLATATVATMFLNLAMYGVDTYLIRVPNFDLIQIGIGGLTLAAFVATAWRLTDLPASGRDEARPAGMGWQRRSIRVAAGLTFVCHAAAGLVLWRAARPGQGVVAMPTYECLMAAGSSAGLCLMVTLPALGLLIAGVIRRWPAPALARWATVATVALTAAVGVGTSTWVAYLVGLEFQLWVTRDVWRYTEAAAPVQTTLGVFGGAAAVVVLTRADREVSRRLQRSAVSPP